MNSKHAADQPSSAKAATNTDKPVILEKRLQFQEIQLFTVQLAAFRDEEKAEKSAALLNQKHKDRLVAKIRLCVLIQMCYCGHDRPRAK